MWLLAIYKLAILNIVITYLQHFFKEIWMWLIMINDELDVVYKFFDTCFDTLADLSNYNF